MNDKILLCCGKDNKYLVQGEAKPMHDCNVHNPFNYNWKLVDDGYKTERLNGKIIAEANWELETENDPCGNTIFIKNLHAYIRPHNISECLKIKKGMRDMCYGYFNPSLEGDTFNYLKSIPKKIQKVWLAEYDQIKPYFIITVSPEEACRILNGKQTVITARELPKEMSKQWKNG